MLCVETFVCNSRKDLNVWHDPLQANEQQLSSASDVAAAAVAALEAEEVAAAAAAAAAESKDSSETEDSSPITVTVTSGGTQYIAMAGKLAICRPGQADDDTMTS